MSLITLCRSLPVRSSSDVVRAVKCGCQIDLTWVSSDQARSVCPASLISIAVQEADASKDVAEPFQKSAAS